MLIGKLRVLARLRWLVFLAGLLAGGLVILTIRFATYQPPAHTHYHANFAVYINGQREEFKSPQYYQEEAICSTGHGITLPAQRAHMHDNVNDVVHVHDTAVTWGQFFENIGWSVGADFIADNNGVVYAANGQSKLHILIDGQDYTDLTSIAAMVIKDRSRLLVSYGDIGSTSLQQEYKSVPSTAKHYDESKDTASCSGTESATFKDRLHHLF